MQYAGEEISGYVKASECQFCAMESRTKGNETSQDGSMRGSRRKTGKSVLRVAEGRAGVSDKGVPLYSTPHGSPTETYRFLFDARYGLQLMSDGYIIENVLAELRGQ